MLPLVLIPIGAVVLVAILVFVGLIVLLLRGPKASTTRFVTPGTRTTERRRPDQLDPDDEKIVLSGRPRYPTRKWDPGPGAAKHQATDDPDGLIDEDLIDDNLIDEDDRPASARPRHAANKWEPSEPDPDDVIDEDDRPLADRPRRPANRWESD